MVKLTIFRAASSQLDTNQQRTKEEETCHSIIYIKSNNIFSFINMHIKSSELFSFFKYRLTFTDLLSSLKGLPIIPSFIEHNVMCMTLTHARSC